MDKELLLKPRLPEAEVEVPGLGTVRVRALSRMEVIAMRKATDMASNLDGPRALVIERKMIAAGMVDPRLTEDEVRQWQDVSPAGEIEPVTLKITELSGMNTDSKSGVPGVRDESGGGVRVLPGAEAGDDGGADAPGDD